MVRSGTPMYWNGLLAPALLLLFAQTMCAHAVSAHQSITRGALKYLKEYMPPEEWERFSSCGAIPVLLHEAVAAEDNDPGNRFMFHFYPPLKNRIRSKEHIAAPFFSGGYTTLLAEAECSSFKWAQLPPGESCKHNMKVELGPANWVRAWPLVLGAQRNEFTWAAAVENGRLSSSFERRKGWIAMGHVLHLLQDLTSPAHVRNSVHPHFPSEPLPFGDPDPLETLQGRPAWPDPGDPPPPPGRRVTPCDDVPSCFNTLQKWTQRNFYSKWTVGMSLEDIVAGDLTPSGTPLGPTMGDKDAQGFFYGSVTINPDSDVSHRRKVARETPRSLVNASHLTRAIVDKKVAIEQWKDLGPAAILYSARLIYAYWKLVNEQTPCAPAADYDLAVPSLTAEQPAFVGRPVKLTVRVENRGQKTLSYLRQSFSVNSPSEPTRGVQQVGCVIKGLGPGQTKECSAEMPVSAVQEPDDYTFEVRADDSNSLPVKDRKNLTNVTRVRIARPPEGCVEFSGTVRDNPVGIPRVNRGLFSPGVRISGYYFYSTTDYQPSALSFGGMSYWARGGIVVRANGNPVIGGGDNTLSGPVISVTKNTLAAGFDEYGVSGRFLDTLPQLRRGTFITPGDTPQNVRSRGWDFRLSLSRGDSALSDSRLPTGPPPLERFGMKTLTLFEDGGSYEYVTADVQTLGGCSP